jgi:hypothetical protein
MAYEKKNNYPSVKKSGIYQDVDSKELGLTNNNLENLSLGHWPEIHRDNRIFLSRDNVITETVEDSSQPNILTDIPIYLVPHFTPELKYDYEEDNEQGGYGRDTAYRFFSEVFVYKKGEGNATEIFKGSYEEAQTAVANDGYTKQILSNSGFGLPYIVSVADFFRDRDGSPTPQANYGNAGNDATQGSPLGTRANVTIIDNNLELPETPNNVVFQEVISWMRERQIELYDFLRESPIFLTENPIPGDESYGVLETDTSNFIPDNPLKLEFADNKQIDLDVITSKEKIFEVTLIGSNGGTVTEIVEGTPTSFFMKLNIILDRPTQNSVGEPVTFDDIRQSYTSGANLNASPQPRVFPQDSQNGMYESDYFVSHLIDFDQARDVWDATDGRSYEPNFNLPVIAIDDKDEDGLYNAFIPNLKIDEFFGQLGTPHEDVQPEREAYLREKIGWPNFSIDVADETSYEFESQDELIFSSLYDDFASQLLPDTPYIDYQINCFYSKSDIDDNKIYKNNFTNYKDENFLYYDYTGTEEAQEKYIKTSYPVKVNLIIDLFEITDFENEQLPFDVEALSNVSNQTSFQDAVNSATANPRNSFYKYKVLSWGDEKILKSNNAIENSFYFKMYDVEDYPAENSYIYKKNKADQIVNSMPIINKDSGGVFYNISSHVYTQPGPKTIKIILYRYTKDGLFLLSSTLIRKNININDGLLLSQNFSIFGASDFNFLPIIDNQAVIGGFDDESKYHNSVSKIVKDDNFIQDDFLERVSSRDYIKKINNGSLGKQPGQLDLGQTRVFTEPKDIYDFIGANKLEWINQGSGSLPINSLATDIFIRDDKCVVDLNPSNSEYSAIQNQAGSEEIGILIGDYKVNQPEGSRIQKEGIMETPLLETDNEKQAF